MSKMDPSCCIGFYLRTRDEFETWCEGIAEFATPPDKGGRRQYPMFTVHSEGGSAADYSAGEDDKAGEEWTQMDREEEEVVTPENKLQSEEFVFL